MNYYYYYNFFVLNSITMNLIYAIVRILFEMRKQNRIMYMQIVGYNITMDMTEAIEVLIKSNRDTDHTRNKFSICSLVPR